jgi:hypothetical protein
MRLLQCVIYCNAGQLTHRNNNRHNPTRRQVRAAAPHTVAPMHAVRQSHRGGHIAAQKRNTEITVIHYCTAACAWERNGDQQSVGCMCRGTWSNPHTLRCADSKGKGEARRCRKPVVWMKRELTCYSRLSPQRIDPWLRSHTRDQQGEL